MKRITLFIIISALWLTTHAQNRTDFGSKSNSGYVFGVRIAASWSSPVTFFEAYYTGSRLKDVRFLPKNVFIKKLEGKIRSKANPFDTVNLFKYYNIKNPGVIDSLWKLRYAVYPFATKSRDTLGWTGHFSYPFVPYPKQKQILANIGMDTHQYVIFGENFFRLLRLMNNPNWVNKYKNARE